MIYPVKITHPQKILLLKSGISKQDIIDYYLQVSKPILNYATGRPLSFKRYINGFPGQSFFQRNKPKYAPEWIHSQSLGINKKANYIIPENIETFLWLVNQETLEFHIAQTKKPAFMMPDMLVFDLDPPHKKGENLYDKFKMIRDLALEIKPIIESFGYKTFPKTSGKKGVHVFCPVNPVNTYDEVFEAAKEIGEEIVSRLKNVTLRIAKEKRVDKTLIDIYRNHTLQSMSMPYGMRATDKGNISTPLTWEKLQTVETPEEFTIKTVPDLVKQNGDPWQDIYKFRKDLHTRK